MARILLIAVGMLALIAAIIVLPGDLLRTMGGVDDLDINGNAALINANTPTQTGWPAYGGDEGGSRYSSLNQITPQNVDDLEIAWTFSTGDMEKRTKVMNRSAAEATPILVDDKLIFCSPFNEVIALDPGAGREVWRYDPKIDLDQRPANQFVCRGVAYWRTDNPDEENDACARRIITATNDGRIIALDAANGAPCENFGAAGEVKVDAGMALLWPGEFQFTSPPVVAGDTIIVGSSISDNGRVEAPKGVVRAYNVRTGALKWTFDPIPRTADAPNADSWRGEGLPVEGHANAWAPMSVDQARGLVFVPTSSPSPDFYGGLRPGDNRYANSVVALKAETGEVAWAFQTVHHDVWDYDLPAQPSLLTIRQNGAPRDVVAQVAKTGFVFVLDRDTGEPVLPVEERPVPQGGAADEALSPTQPFPVAPPPIVPNELSPDDAFGLTWFDKRACRRKIADADNEGLFTPPSERGMLQYPMSAGGANWGGAAFDPARNLLIVNMNNAAHHIQLLPTDQIEAVREVFHDSEIAPQTGAPYGVKRDLLFSPFGLPCTPPPWGVIAGVDLGSGEIVWRKTLGTVEDFTGGVIKTKFGTPAFGGPIATAGGLTFIGATMDDYIRAFSTETGEELWRGRLPGGGQATPMTYEWQGRQYVVIYAGGHARAGTTLNDELVAFALGE